MTKRSGWRAMQSGSNAWKQLSRNTRKNKPQKRSPKLRRLTNYNLLTRGRLLEICEMCSLYNLPELDPGEFAYVDTKELAEELGWNEKKTYDVAKSAHKIEILSLEEGRIYFSRDVVKYFNSYRITPESIRQLLKHK